MKYGLFMALLVVGSAAGLCAQRKAQIPVVHADAPTIIAFFPQASSLPPNDDSNEALADFGFYWRTASEGLEQLGVKTDFEEASSFHVRAGGKSVLFTPKRGNCGYYLTGSGKQARVLYGVMTDSDLVETARTYFGAPLPEVLRAALAEVKGKSRIPVLLPLRLAGPLSAGKFAKAEHASEREYEIGVYTDLHLGDAGFSALFAGERGAKYEPEELTNTFFTKLNGGQRAYFRPVSCGGSCAPANLWWKQDEVLYHIQLKMPSTVGEEEQQRAIVAIADSAIFAGPR